MALLKGIVIETLLQKYLFSESACSYWAAKRSRISLQDLKLISDCWNVSSIVATMQQHAELSLLFHEAIALVFASVAGSACWG
jgi:hypothetical protein